MGYGCQISDPNSNTVGKLLSFWDLKLDEWHDQRDPDGSVFMRNFQDVSNCNRVSKLETIAPLMNGTWSTYHGASRSGL
jgi:hypothetical protein